MNRSARKTTCIACSTFEKELTALQTDGDLDLQFQFVDSALHMDPERLNQRLEEITDQEEADGNRVVLAYGDCHAHMIDLENRPNVTRTKGISCYEIVLGGDTFRKYRDEGAFFLMPEWTSRWRELFTSGLGLTDDNAPGFMGEMHDKLVYLDTGLVPVPEAELQAFSDFCRLPHEVVKVSLEPLLHSIRSALGDLEALKGQ